jgi:hypothetical protein
MHNKQLCSYHTEALEQRDSGGGAWYCGVANLKNVFEKEEARSRQRGQVTQTTPSQSNKTLRGKRMVMQKPIHRTSCQRIVSEKQTRAQMGARRKHFAACLSNDCSHALTLPLTSNCNLQQRGCQFAHPKFSINSRCFGGQTFPPSPPISFRFRFRFRRRHLLQRAEQSACIGSKPRPCKVLNMYQTEKW